MFVGLSYHGSPILRRFASLRAQRSNPEKRFCPLDCFVVPPRNDAKRVGAKR